MTNSDSRPITLILDTDIGDDIDDALAVALLLGSPEVELNGITTVFRDGARRAQLAHELLQGYNRDVPVAAGVSQPLLQSWSAIARGANLGRQFEAVQSQPGKFPHAFDFLRAQIEATNEAAPQLVWLCIGPLTNAALFLRSYPALASRLRILLMGGALHRHFPNEPGEWNIACDPEAAQIVFNAGADVRVVPLDVTLQCQLSPAQTAQLIADSHNGSEGARLLGELVRLWCEETHSQPILHDPLAALCVFSDVVTWQPMNLQVELCGEARGVTREQPGAPNVQIALQVDAPRAIEEFLKRVARA